MNSMRVGSLESTSWETRHWLRVRSSPGDRLEPASCGSDEPTISGSHAECCCRSRIRSMDVGCRRPTVSGSATLRLRWAGQPRKDSGSCPRTQLGAPNPEQVRPALFCAKEANSSLAPISVNQRFISSALCRRRKCPKLFVEIVAHSSTLVSRNLNTRTLPPSFPEKVCGRRLRR
jgi:hypothetical protein